MKKLDVEMKKTDLLLYQMIPKKIADQLRSGEKAASLCEVRVVRRSLFNELTNRNSESIRKKTTMSSEQATVVISLPS